MKAAFHLLDLDNSGYITKNELRLALGSGVTTANELIWLKFMDELDTNKDN